MNKRKNVYRLKIFASLLLALIVVSYGGPNVFVSGTTQVRSDFIARIRSNPLQAFSSSSNNSSPQNSSENKEDSKKNPTSDIAEENLTNTHPDKAGLNFVPIGGGVYAAEDPVTKKKYYKIEKGVRLEKKYVTIDGREVMIYVPAQ